MQYQQTAANNVFIQHYSKHVFQFVFNQMLFLNDKKLQPISWTQATVNTDHHFQKMFHILSLHTRNGKFQ